MAFRLAPRTVWGTRRWFLGRETYDYTMSYREWFKTQYHVPTRVETNRYGIPRRVDNYSTLKDRMRDRETQKRFERERKDGKLTYKKETSLTKWSSRVYYANQFARTIWWYAQDTGALDAIDPGLAAGFQLTMGIATHAMGLIATAGAVVGGISTGQPWMAAAAALSIPIQLSNMTGGIDATIAAEELRLYFDKRDKRLAQHIYSGG